MSKTRWLIITAIILPALVALPLLAMSAEAQNVPPAVLAGKAYLDGEPAPAGTLIRAIQGTTVLGEAVTQADGTYSIQISQPRQGLVVNFLVGDARADFELTWRSGLPQLVDLRASPGVAPAAPAATLAAPTATPVATLAPTPTAAPPPRTAVGPQGPAGSQGPADHRALRDLPGRREKPGRPALKEKKARAGVQANPSPGATSSTR